MAARMMVEVWRGPLAESVHAGHAVVCDGTGEIVEAWGDPEAVILPRSSAKMIQALPLVASGAADAFSLSTERLALSCASHEGAPVHNGAVREWLADIGRSESDLICGPQPSRDKDLWLGMIPDDQEPRRLLNDCSGKHTGFLTLTRPPGAGADDWASQRGDLLSRSAARLVEAMIAHPLLVAGEGRACTLMMQAAKEPVAIKTGAEGYFIAILPERGLGISLKIADGATRASECAMAAILVRLGVLSAEHPDVKRFLNPEIRNWDGRVTGWVRPAPGVF